MAKYAINEEFLQKIENLQIVLKNNIAGMFGGNHGSKAFGSSCEFTDYREYIPGDDITKIDWNAYARTENLFLKLYFDERQLSTKIYIDVSKSMASEGKDITTIEIAATMAYLAICELDRVSIYTIRNSQVEEVISGMVGKERFYAEITKLNEIEFYGDCFISEGIMPAEVGYGDGVSVIISDFLTDNDYENAIDFLVDKKRDLVCVQVMSLSELNPQLRGKNHLFDSEDLKKYYRKNIDKEVVKAYREASKFVRERLQNYCLDRGANYFLCPSNKPIDKLFFEDMTGVGVLK